MSQRLGWSWQNKQHLIFVYFSRLSSVNFQAASSRKTDKTCPFEAPHPPLQWASSDFVTNHVDGLLTRSMSSSIIPFHSGNKKGVTVQWESNRWIPTKNLNWTTTKDDIRLVSRILCNLLLPLAGWSPTVLFSVSYPSEAVLGVELTKEEATCERHHASECIVSRPDVYLRHDGAPSREDPKNRQFRNWAITDLRTPASPSSETQNMPALKPRTSSLVELLDHH
ncbi:hypothetical protein C8J56DRAFT_1027169 [Mycena floridula]|nr:hypothetical protein C8J56DRAFT_1027169 [Mycena floridula]